MKIKVNTAIIKSLNPCLDRFDNWMQHYASFDGDLLDFLHLEAITAYDKIWISIRLLPIEQLEYFTIDAAFSINPYFIYNFNDYNTDAISTAATISGDAATFVAAITESNLTTWYTDFDAERERQVDALIYLYETMDSL